jgi:predicted  nucleic acid-binding Zn-ribbon protein
MKAKLTSTVFLIALVLVLGCSKKDQPQPTEPTQAETAAPAMPETTKEAVVETVKQVFSTDVDLEKTVADLKTEAAQMDVASLKEAAAKYKKMISEKDIELESLMDKLSAIPMTEKLGKEGQALTSEVKTLTNDLTALKDRFQVYIDALSAKGA